MPNALERLEIPLRLTFPVISCQTFEVGRAESVFQKVASKIGQQGKPFESVNFQFLPMPKNIESAAKKHGDMGVVIFDQYFFDRMKVNPETLPALKASLKQLENLGVNYVICGKESLKEEFVYHITLPPMQQDDIVELIKSCEKSIGTDSVFTDSERSELANHARGLSFTQMSNVFNYSAYLKHKGQPYLEEVRREKSHILRDVGLDVLPTINISEVGGMTNIKEFLQVRKAGWDRDLPVKGVLLAGVPGGGKTLIAKAAASVLGTTLLRLDFGKFYSKFVGETERQFNRALQTIDQIAPVVVLIDEMEKYLGAAQGEHEISQRLLGSFLFWLQERKEKVFIVGTANRVHSLPPELMRAGRWDKAFFVDLPTDEEKVVIFNIHLRKNGADPDRFNMATLLKQSKGFTGAEIEQSVVDAMYLANASDAVMDNDMLLDALSQVTPTSETRREDIEAIQQLKKQGFYPANKAAEPVEAENVRKIIQ